MNKELRAWLRTPPVKWAAKYAKADTNDRMFTADQAAGMAIHLARISAYLSRRMSGGKHEDAVKRQNQAARGVRQALGYTYADDKIGLR